MKHLLICLVLSASLMLSLTFFSTGIILGWGHEYKLVLAAFSYCCLTIWQLQKSENKYSAILCIALPPVLLLVPIHIYDCIGTWLAIPSTFFHFVGILFGALVYFSKGFYSKAAYIFVLTFLSLSMFIYGYPMWLHKKNYGTFSSKIVEPAPKFKFENESGAIITNQDFKGKTLIADFWTTSCGICFKKFPIAERLSQKLKNRNDIIFYAINNPLERDTKEHSINMVRERNLTFNILFADMKICNEQFKFNGYPTVVVIENGDKITFKGDINDVENLLGL